MTTFICNSETNDMIAVLRKRICWIKFIAFISIFVTLIILGGGLYSFAIMPSIIVLQDIEQQRKSYYSGDTVNVLTKLNREIRENKQNMERLLPIISGKQYISIDDFLISAKNKISFYTAELNKSTIELGYPPFSKLQRINELEEEIKETNKLLSDDNANDKLVEIRHRQRVHILDQMEDLHSSIKAYKEQLVHVEQKVPISLRNEYINSVIENKTTQLAELESSIFEHDKQTHGLLKNFNNEIENVLSANEIALGDIERFKLDAQKKHESETNKHQDDKALLNKMLEKDDELQASKQLFMSEEKSTTAPSDNKLAFHISTNVARLGILILTIFFAQVFFSIYRYSVKISNFYCARADALDLLNQSGLYKSENFPHLFEDFSTVMTPNQIDFGKLPESGINETLKNIESHFNKR